MLFQNSLASFSKEVKYLITTFLVVLSVGFFSGITFVENTSGFKTQGIEENYLGNEDNEDSEVMKFKKSDKHMLNIIHSHILSMGVIFFLVGGLVSMTSINKTIKKILMIEPLVSVLVTFGGIYLLWNGVLWMKYVIMVSGMLMTLSFGVSIILILLHLYKKESNR